MVLLLSLLLPICPSAHMFLSHLYFQRLCFALLCKPALFCQCFHSSAKCLFSVPTTSYLGQTNVHKVPSCGCAEDAEALRSFHHLSSALGYLDLGALGLLFEADMAPFCSGCHCLVICQLTSVPARSPCKAKADPSCPASCQPNMAMLGGKSVRSHVLHLLWALRPPIGLDQ